jgi:hypothetical protein
VPCRRYSREVAASLLSSLQRLSRCFLHLAVGVATGDLLKRRSDLGVVLPVRAEIADGVRPGERIGGRHRRLHDSLHLSRLGRSDKPLSLSCRLLYSWRAEGFLLPFLWWWGLRRLTIRSDPDLLQLRPSRVRLIDYDKVVSLQNPLYPFKEWEISKLQGDWVLLAFLTQPDNRSMVQPAHFRHYLPQRDSLHWVCLPGNAIQVMLASKR